MVVNVKRILLVEDSLNDAEVTLAALAEHHLANEVDVARDDEEALDYLYCRGRFQEREGSAQKVMLLICERLLKTGLFSESQHCFLSTTKNCS